MKEWKSICITDTFSDLLLYSNGSRSPTKKKHRVIEKMRTKENMKNGIACRCHRPTTAPSWTLCLLLSICFVLPSAVVLLAVLGSPSPSPLPPPSTPPPPSNPSQLMTTTPNVTKVFILSGQSNMVGFGVASEYSFNHPERMSITCAGQCAYSNAVGRLDVHKLSYGFGRGERWFGPELGVAQRLLYHNYSDTDVVLMKVSWGAQPISQFLPGGFMFPLLNDTISLLRQRYQGAEFEAMFWMQGESDSLAFEEATKYEQRFFELVQILRSIVPNLPVISGLIKELPVWTYHEIVRDALRNVSTHVVETTDLSLMDSVHYDSSSTIILGERFVDALISSSDILE